MAAGASGRLRAFAIGDLYGKSGEFATNRRDQQLGMLALHILQAALVYVNTSR